MARHLRSFADDARSLIPPERVHGLDQERRSPVVRIEQDELCIRPRGGEHEPGNTSAAAELENHVWRTAAETLKIASCNGRQPLGVTHLGIDGRGAEEAKRACFL